MDRAPVLVALRNKPLGRWLAAVALVTAAVGAVWAAASYSYSALHLAGSLAPQGLVTIEDCDACPARTCILEVNGTLFLGVSDGGAIGLPEPQEGVIIGDAVAGAIGARPGSVILVNGTTVTVSGIYRSRGAERLMVFLPDKYECEGPPMAVSRDPGAFSVIAGETMRLVLVWAIAALALAGYAAYKAVEGSRLEESLEALRGQGEDPGWALPGLILRASIAGAGGYLAGAMALILLADVAYTISPLYLPPPPATIILSLLPPAVATVMLGSLLGGIACLRRAS